MNMNITTDSKYGFYNYIKTDSDPKVSDTKNLHLELVQLEKDLLKRGNCLCSKPDIEFYNLFIQYQVNKIWEMIDTLKEFGFPTEAISKEVESSKKDLNDAADKYLSKCDFYYKMKSDDDFLEASVSKKNQNTHLNFASFQMPVETSESSSTRLKQGLISKMNSSKSEKSEEQHKISKETIASSVQMLPEGCSLALDLTPVVGTAKGVAQLVTGKDMITGTELSRLGEGVGVVLSFIPFGRLLSKAKRALTVADFGGKGIKTISGEMQIYKGVAKVFVQELKTEPKQIGNFLQIVGNLKRAAKEEGAQFLEIEAYYINKKLANVFEKMVTERYGGKVIKSNKFELPHGLNEDNCRDIFIEHKILQMPVE